MAGRGHRSDLTERPLPDSYLSPMREGQQCERERPAGVSARTGVNDPKLTPRMLRSVIETWEAAVWVFCSKHDPFPKPCSRSLTYRLRLRKRSSAKWLGWETERCQLRQACCPAIRLNAAGSSNFIARPCT